MSQSINGTPAIDIIFRRRFRCKIPMMYCYSEEYLKEVGVTTTMDKQWDKELMLQLNDVEITIAHNKYNNMLDLYSRGSDIHLYNPREAEDIYIALITHLNTWRGFIERSLHPIVPPIEDLQLMDEFAEAIHPTAYAKAKYGRPFNDIRNILFGENSPFSSGPFKNDGHPLLRGTGEVEVKPLSERKEIPFRASAGPTATSRSIEPRHDAVADAIARAHRKSR